jgi:hypothetical protein
VAPELGHTIHCGRGQMACRPRPHDKDSYHAHSLVCWCKY